MYCPIVDGYINEKDCQVIQCGGGDCGECEFNNHFVWYMLTQSSPKA